MTKVHSDEGTKPGNGSSKRRKTSLVHDAVDNLSDLSGDSLAAIADYLPKTSRALMAVALTAPPSAWRERGWTGQPNDAGRAILSASASSSGPFSSVLEMNRLELKGSTLYKNWDEGLTQESGRQKIRLEEYYGASEGGGWAVLDFLDLDTDLACKLTDDDIGAMLACIDARNNLKRLYLSKCSGLVGDGLEPLRGSAVLTQIDFKILHLETSTYWGPNPKETCFSLEKAFSVLGSILTGEGSALRRMEVPRSWIMPVRKNKLNEQFMKFLSGHKHALNISRETSYFGFGESKEDFVANYISQQRGEPTEQCGCGRSSWTKCVDCDIIMCSDAMCRIEADNARICDQCDKTTCLQCVSDGDPTVSYCESDMCAPYCDECRYISCRGGDNECECCRGMMFDRLLQESAVQAAEIERLRNENIDLLRTALENGGN